MRFAVLLIRRHHVMSRLHYLSLPDADAWDRTFQNVSAQVSPFHRYLKVAIEAVRRSRPVLGWRAARAEEVVVFQARAETRYQRERHRSSVATRRRDRPNRMRPSGEWLVLEAPPWRPEEMDETFDTFLDAREIYDVSLDRPNRGLALAVLDRDLEGRALLLDQLPTPVVAKRDAPPSVSAPSGPLLWLVPNTWSLECQQYALRSLENEPSPRVAPLVRLFTVRGSWRPIMPAVLSEQEWAFLRTEAPGGRLRDGTEEQRRFVSIALATPDFAILEGPPGSGKSTAIGELIVQTIRRGGRVLLTASTHVAVDNVLERLLAWQDASADKPVLPVRIGDEERVSSDALVPWTYRRLLATWRGELVDFLERPKGVAPEGGAARRLLLDALTGADGEHVLPRLLLESANLVCGTTIGILQHPAIKASRKGEPFRPFDLMILDEASKTTLGEFLVPALHASRWVIVGDVRQLSPYVEEQHLTDNLAPLVDETLARVTTCAFLAARPARGKVTSIVAVRTPEEGALLRAAATARRVSFVEAEVVRAAQGPVPELLYADLVFGSPEALAAIEDRIPGDLEAQLGPLPPLERWRAQRRALNPEDKAVDWAAEVAWRLVRSYELRQSPEERGRLDAEIEALIPDALPDDSRKRVLRSLHDLRRVALPSILELLQRGFERLEGWRDDVPVTAGLPPQALSQRLVSLRFQHRMHPAISLFPRERFYQASPEPLLQDASNLIEERAWTWNRYARRALWVDLAPERRRGDVVRGNANLPEAQCILDGIAAFGDWALAGNVRRDERGRVRPWEVAALTFYRGQEALLRRLLQQRTRQHGNARNFHIGEGDLRDAVHVTLCTVDRFQGHEADVVFISFVQSGRVGFLNSPNRLNVALTRARYQLVLVGHRAWFASDRCGSELLRTLAQSPHYGLDLGWKVSR